MLVLFSHCVPLALGSDEREPLLRLTGLTGGAWAVNGFFILSGYLITQSWQRAPVAGDFLRKRALRIYPGFLVAFAVSAAIGMMTNDATLVGDLKRIVWNGERLLREVVYLDYGWLNMLGAFPTNPYPISVNGSLWTLQPELRCYGVVLALGMLGALRSVWIVRGLWLSMYVWHVTNLFVLPELHNDMVRLLTYFLTGAAWTTWPIRASNTGLLLGVAALCAAAAFPPLGAIAAPALFGLVLFEVAYSRMTIAPGFFERWDLSYGAYLYAFPIQQTMVWLGVRSPWLLLSTSLPLTLLCATLSWMCVESPTMRLKRRVETPGVQGGLPVQAL